MNIETASENFITINKVMKPGLEGGGPVRDLPGTAKGVWRLGQVQLTGYLGRVRHGTQISSAPPDVLEAIDDGSTGRRILQDGVSGSVGKKDLGECGQEGRHQDALFYADDGTVESLYPSWLQGAFNTLVGLFDRVGLRTNFGKTVGMVCRLCQVSGNQPEVAYRRQITGEGPTYRERQKGRVQCRERGEEMAEGSVAGHNMTQHGRAAEEQRSWKTSATGEDPRIYCMTFLAKGGLRSCPMEGYPVLAATRTTMRVHFLHRHVLDTVVILEEGNIPHQRCPRYDMLVPRQALNRTHPTIAQCAMGADQKRRRLAEADKRESLERVFEA